MANKQRLIDADALKSEFDWLKSVVNESSKDEVMDVMQRIDNAPTVDAVEVVRCADCVLEGTGNCPMVHRDPILGNLYCTFPANGGYCSKGVRRGKDAVD